MAAEALASLDITVEAVRERVEDTIGIVDTAPSGSPPFTPRTKKILELAWREALQLGHIYIGTEHLLLGIVRESDGVAAGVLVSLGVDLNRVRQQVIQLMSDTRVTRPAAEMDVDVIRLRPRAVASVPTRCALCETALSKKVHFVAGSTRRVCDDCIRTAARVLDEAPPHRRQISMPPKVFGDAADQEAASAIVDTVQMGLSISTDPESRPTLIEDFDALKSVFRQYGAHLAPEPYATRLVGVRFPPADFAVVWFEITTAEVPPSSVDESG